MTPTFYPFKPPVRRKRRAGADAAAPAAAPVLVAASFDVGAGTLTLAFDQAVDAPAVPSGMAEVKDGPAGATYAATGAATRPSPAVVVLEMAEDKEFAGPGVTLTTGGPTGVVAVDGGLAWAGVDELGLPFP